MLAAGLGVAAVFASGAAVNAVAAFCICRLLPDELLKSLFAIPLRLAFRVQVNGLDNCRKAGPRAVIVANHVSFLDGVLLAVFLPGHPVFAVDTYIARRWWARPFLALTRVFTVDPGNPFAAKEIGRASCRERVCQYVSISVVAVSLKKKKTKKLNKHTRPRIHQTTNIQ